MNFTAGFANKFQREAESLAQMSACFRVTEDLELGMAELQRIMQVCDIVSCIRVSTYMLQTV